MTTPVRTPKNTADEKDFVQEPINDEEQHVAVCIGVYYIGFQEGDYKGEPYCKEEIVLEFEVDEKYSKAAGDYAGKRKRVTKRFTFSYATKANLYKTLCSWFGKGYIDKKKEEMKDNLAALNIYMLLGKSCLISVYHSEKNDKIYANIDSISKLPKTMESFKPSRLQTEESDDLPKRIKELIEQSVEEEAPEPIKKKKSKPEIEDDADDAPPPKKTKPKPQVEEEDDEDDDPLGGGTKQTTLEDDDID